MRLADRMNSRAPTESASRSGGCATATTIAAITRTSRTVRRPSAIRSKGLRARTRSASRRSGCATGKSIARTEPMKRYFMYKLQLGWVVHSFLRLCREGAFLRAPRMGECNCEMVVSLMPVAAVYHRDECCFPRGSQFWRSRSVGHEMHSPYFVLS